MNIMQSKIEKKNKQRRLLSKIAKVNKLWDAHKKQIAKNKIMTREYNSRVNKEMKVRDNEERLVWYYLKKLDSEKIKYEKEKRVQNSRIDILTDKYVIEAKKSSSPQHIYQAIGQLKYYQLFYPRRELKILIPTEPNMRMKDILKKMNILYEVYDNDYRKMDV